MESERPSTINETYKQQQELEEEEEEDDDDDNEEEEEEEENNEILKRRISNHPLYGLLVEAHLDCLKVLICFFFSPFISFLPSSIYCFQPQFTLLIYLQMHWIQLKLHVS